MDRARIPLMSPLSPRSPLRLRVIAAVVTVAFAVTACQTTTSPPPSASASPSAPAASPTAPTQSATPSADPAAIYEDIEAEVRAIRGLEASSPVNPIVLDDAGIRKLTADSFRRDNPTELVAANERLLKGLGLLPADASLEDLYIEMLGGQVAGLYNPDDKKMYVLSRSGTLGPAEKTTFAHEYTHALQDQNFGIDTLDITEVGEGDRGIARLALVEGDATLLMTLWQIQNLDTMELLELIGQSLNPEITGSLDAMPAVLRESLLFPYTGGLPFVQAIQIGGWSAVNDAYANPPESTEQVLHPEKYVMGEEPVDVTLPDDLAARMGDGWKVGLEDTFGEFQLRLWLDQATAADGAPSSTDAAAGWGGDRIALLDGPNDEWAIAMSTAWDTAGDAEEFADHASLVVDGLDSAVEVLGSRDPSAVTVVLASTGPALDQLKAALGS
jgi:hypothetical protein